MNVTHNHLPGLLISAFLSLGVMNPAFSAVPASHAKNVMVDMVDDSFSPATIVTNVGQRVTWVNRGSNDHNVKSSDGSFSSGIIPPGQSFSHVFTKPGTYYYKCTKHTILFWGMKGKVIVR